MEKALLRGQLPWSGATPPLPKPHSALSTSIPLHLSAHFKPFSNDSAARAVLSEKDSNQTSAAALLWHGASSKFTASIIHRFYKDNSLDKARKLKETAADVKIERVKMSRLARIQQQKEELEQIKAKQKAMKSRIKQFLEERVELEHKFEGAAVVIQRHIRGFLARRKAAVWLYEQEKLKLGELLGLMQRQIHTFWTGTGEQANLSAMKIQALYRGFRARQEVKSLHADAKRQQLEAQTRDAAVGVIQRSYRLYASRRKQQRMAALEAIRKRLLVLKLKSFWHRKKLFWACMRKKYQVQLDHVPSVAPAVQKRPNSAKRTGGGYAMVEIPTPAKPRGLSIEAEPQNSLEVRLPVPPATKPPTQEGKRPTVPLIPRPRVRPPRAPRPEEDRRPQLLNLTAALIEQPEKRSVRSYSDSPPKYLAPTSSSKYRTGVDASVEMPRPRTKGRRRKPSESTLTRPTLSRQQYLEESKDKRSQSADSREKNWKPTVGMTKEVKALPPASKEPLRLPSSLHSEDEDSQVSLSKRIDEKEVSAVEMAAAPLLLPEQSFTYRPPVKQSLDFKEALPEYQDFLQKYGKNVKTESRPDTNRSTAKSLGDLIRISARDSVKKAEL